VKRLGRIISALSLLFILGFGSAVPVSAACDNNGNPLECACESGGVSNNSACKADTSNPITGPNGVIKKISLVIAFVAGVAAVIVILIAGLMYVTSGGDAQKAASARSAILGAVIGLFIVAASESIVIFVVNKL
jgi:hypothetical protein